MQEALGCNLIAPLLDQHVQHDAVPIGGWHDKLSARGSGKNDRRHGGWPIACPLRRRRQMSVTARIPPHL
jgi:hypothetical protein